MKHIYGSVVFLAFCACAPNSQTGSGTETDLEASCEALVAAETGRGPGDVSTLSTQSSPTGTVTSVSVAGADAPWLCRADAGGVITGVGYSQEG